MDRGWRYRIGSVAGTVLLTVFAVIGTNLQSVHGAFDRVPYFGRPAPEVLAGSELTVAIATTAVIVVAAMWPLFKPQPRRILDTILLTQKRVLIAMVGLAALGYFNYSYRLPRTTLMLTTVVLLVVLPLFLTVIRPQPRSSSRAVIVGDDPEKMSALLAATETPVIGYVSPLSMYDPSGKAGGRFTLQADGSGVATDLDSLRCLGGLSQLDEILKAQNVDTVLIGFHEPNRQDFFGTLEICYDNGVTALMHREYADHILVDESGGGELLQADIEPWDWQDYVLKRLFDVAFASVTLLAVSPLVLVISIAIKLEDGGPILYKQERTAEFGDQFEIAKFRSMIPDAESKSGAKISEEDAGGVDPRVTRVGHVLRKTHLDEIPQLWSILVGDMSVVGPRPERPELDAEIEEGVEDWRRRWFVKPGLTGLAQINDATGAEPDAKLRYDIEYIRRQSFWFDLKIVVRQLWQVGTEALGFVVYGDEEELESFSEDVAASASSEGGEQESDAKRTDEETGKEERMHD